jgi:hypothetical protein
MGKKLNRITIVVITILMGELIYAYTLPFFLPYKSATHPYRSVAITMLLSVCIYYPAFVFINKFLKDFSGKYMRKSSKLIGGQVLGRLLGFSLAVLLIFIAMTQILYKRNAVSDLMSWFGRLF